MLGSVLVTTRFCVDPAPLTAAVKLRDRGLTQDQQATMIEDLRKGYINTLCSTSIAASKSAFTPA